MSAELSEEVSRRLTSDNYGWLTTVAKSGLPVPRLIWFLLEGSSDLIVYSMPQAAKVTHIRRHPQVSLNLNSDNSGGGIIVVGGEATIDAEGVDCRQDKPYWDKYAALSDRFGLTETMGHFSTRIKVGIDKVWTTPTGG